MRKTAVVSSVLLTAALALSGCASNQGDMGNKNIRSQSLHNNRFANDGMNEMNRIHGNQQTNNNVVGYHDNTHLELSQKIADKLAARPDIKSAYVMLTNNNAYVSIVTEGHAAGDGGLSAKSTTTHGAPSLHKRMSTGTTGQYGHMTATQEPSALSDKVKNEVADAVKAMSPSVNNVYVSANPDLYGRMQNYATSVSEGHPIQGFVTEFNALVNRIFPESAGTHHRTNGIAGTGIGTTNDVKRSMR
ncbi:YhcN/YlaJ family sporulation lipoprotein [Cohnella nanjingensis]|uniref:YhcN/YlaJ family sporulation lipoprotein n=1 Tax=Cohnella nanjingensis TaxID=1387779 RepID=A0A7X0RXQ5_9BACL|nr:YhcN/YlaJ family sporulation lipoprotein [Cohnella nanjingensis]MBB6675599.1 YhcN/YlaJ family sporulation lipoprotein [Cohnella nanjingensis]